MHTHDIGEYTLGRGKESWCRTHAGSRSWYTIGYLVEHCTLYMYLQCKYEGGWAAFVFRRMKLTSWPSVSTSPR
eukprot:278880-Pyramimonas_sp.AAC.1